MKRILLVILFIVSLGIYFGENTHGGDFRTTLVDAVLFDTTNQINTSGVVPVQRYDKFSLLIDNQATGSGGRTITVDVQLSDDGTTFYNLEQGSFASLTFESADLRESYTNELSSYYMRTIATCDSCDTGNYNTFSIIGIFNRYE